jgi:hypothetical protein
MKIRSLAYHIKDGFKNIHRNKMFSLASIATITACIFLFGVFYSIVVNFQYMIKKAETEVCVTVFFDENLSETDIKKLGDDISKREEVSRVVDFLKENMTEEAQYDESIAETVAQKTSDSAAVDRQDDKDTLFEDAGRFVIERERGSIGMLQRQFKIGFNRAGRIMDQLSDAGVVGPEIGTKPRKVLMDKEEFEAYINSAGS